MNSSRWSVVVVVVGPEASLQQARPAGQARVSRLGDEISRAAV